MEAQEQEHVYLAARTVSLAMEMLTTAPHA
jgi:hypothetical protein